MIIDIQDFKGEAPSMSSRLLPDGMATVARNCRIGFGDMRPLDAMTTDHFIGFQARSIYRHHGTWLEYPDFGRRFVPSPVAGDPQRLYMTAASGGAYVYAGAATTKLGVKAPAAALVAAASGGSGTPETRVYVYTCVSSLGEESAPSPASATVDVLPGGTVSLTGLNTPAHDGYAPITKKRIYRSAVGASGASAYLFVAEIDAAATACSDAKTLAQLGEALPTLGWLEPPADIKGLVSVQGGVVAGFSGREVRLCEPWFPHAWPDAYANSVEFDIVQIAASGRTVFIFTTGGVYSMLVDDPAQAAPERLAGHCPAYGTNAVFETPYGVIFASREGLYLVAPGMATPQLITGGLFDQPDWGKLNLSSMFGAWAAGQLFVFYQDIFGTPGGYIFTYTESGFTLTSTDVFPDAITVVPDAERLFLSAGGACYEWAGDGAWSLGAIWRSKEYVTPSPVNFGAAIVEAEYDAAFRSGGALSFAEERLAYLVNNNNGEIGGGLGSTPAGMAPFASDLYGAFAAQASGFDTPVVTFRLYDGKTLVYEHNATDNLPFALPAGRQGRNWFLEVSSLYPVHRVAAAESMGEIYP